MSFRNVLIACMVTGNTSQMVTGNTSQMHGHWQHISDAWSLATHRCLRCCLYIGGTAQAGPQGVLCFIRATWVPTYSTGAICMQEGAVPLF
jgi:hypothetical protein